MNRAAVLVLLALAACDPGPSRPRVPEGALAEKAREESRKLAEVRAKEPQRIKIRHLLVSFEGKVPAATRSQAEAEKLAMELLERIRGGEDMVELIRRYSNDTPRPGDDPGVYGIANEGVPPQAGEAPRSGMVPGFGNTGFSLAVGELGICPYDPVKSPYGWHIIRRLE